MRSLSSLHCDPVEITAKQSHKLFWLRTAHLSGRIRSVFLTADLAEHCARAGRILFPYLPENLVERLLLPPPAVEWMGAREKFIKNHAKRINICPCVHIAQVRIGLLGTHVPRRANGATPTG